MEIKDLLGDEYKDGMTLEEIEAAIKDKTFVDPETLPKSVKKDVFDRTASELAAVKKKLKALEETSMTEEEKKKEAEEKTAELQSKLQKELAKLRAKEIFVGAGLKDEDYKDILDTVVTEDEEVTKTRATGMVNLINAQKKAVAESVKAELLKNTPKPPAGGGGSDVGAFAKEIEEAKKNGNMILAASLIRQQAQLEAQKNK